MKEIPYKLELMEFIFCIFLSILVLSHSFVPLSTDRCSESIIIYGAQDSGESIAKYSKKLKMINVLGNIRTIRPSNLKDEQCRHVIHRYRTLSLGIDLLLVTYYFNLHKLQIKPAERIIKEDIHYIKGSNVLFFVTSFDGYGVAIVDKTMRCIKNERKLYESINIEKVL